MEADDRDYIKYKSQILTPHGRCPGCGKPTPKLSSYGWAFIERYQTPSYLYGKTECCGYPLRAKTFSAWKAEREEQKSRLEHPTLWQRITSFVSRST